MSPELLMYQCRMYALVAQMEGCKAQGVIDEIDGMPPMVKPEHFYAIQAELERLAVDVAGVTS